MDQTSRAWLILAQAELRVAELHGLLSRFGDVETIVAQKARDLVDAGLSDDKSSAILSPDDEELSRSLRWLENDAHHLVTFGHDSYPELLTQIPGRPLLLYVNGSIDALHLPSIAIVGSRNPTRGGLRNSLEFARYLARQGFSIVSGLAEGIDTAAHRGALDAGGGTVAFLGHGIDRVYPTANRDLAHAIVKSGALVSEYPLDARPLPWRFPERNRLISGLCLGTLVIEAARRSGSLITARLAAEQGREVFALPGSIHNPLARGCHELIRQGAKLVETAGDIINELAPLTGHMRQKAEGPVLAKAPPDDNDNDYDELRAILSHDPMSIDEMEIQSGLTIDQLSSMLLILELHGEVESLSGGRYILSN
ncbi:MAG: DNA-processing protein DprA [Gammaproteobacteria bacterium]|nr:DNA-processing protein DprA [Gammaproteobacteria bacterium]MBU2676158.1 DNA-processing protein DprA [Gammaproteobacteria bacterium]NNC57030.1 DNA-protecting protein DprA [Woeseiaceae bacterium]NNL49894.1 DNA-protecting protein DprA [Woeseiaceae bacterium]